jgi:ubiquinone/menaquinone biosynthesis C-methylase UbiE
LAPENNCYWDRGISYIYDDLRYIPIRNDYYDAVFCISVLEHVGLDNTSFAGDSIFNEHNKYDAELVMKELRRVLKPGGALLITVPFGIYQDYGTFQQFDAELLWKAINAFGVAKNTTLTFYKYSSLGWQISTEMDCKTCKYVENTANAWRDHRPVSMIAETDRAAAARAVACLRLTKA